MRASLNGILLGSYSLSVFPCTGVIHRYLFSFFVPFLSIFLFLSFTLFFFPFIFFPCFFFFFSCFGREYDKAENALNTESSLGGLRYDGTIDWSL